MNDTVKTVDVSKEKAHGSLQPQAAETAPLTINIGTEKEKDGD